MYEPDETDISRKELVLIQEECKKRNIPVCVIGGWATYFYVNKNYLKVFGKEYMGSRDIDIFFDPSKEEEFLSFIKEIGFEKNGLQFRWEKIWNRETKKFISKDNAKIEQIHNLIYIFLDVFSNKKTEKIYSWHDLEPLKNISFDTIDNFIVADIDTLIHLKCIALFARDKADKENKDACDLYSLLYYSGKKITSTPILINAIEKMLKRQDLLIAISQHVLLDYTRQSIVEVSLKSILNDIKKDGFYLRM